jgi:uncharacterized membrane protein YidH (DUF202 family)
MRRSGYIYYAANKRTFLAWLRTGIAVIAFEFVIEKFNLLCVRSQVPPQLKWRIDCSSKSYRDHPGGITALLLCSAASFLS